MKSITSRGTGSAPTLAVHDPSNIFVLFTNTNILHIGCSDTQTPKIREALKNIFRPCSVIASCEVSRKKNKFQWVKNYLVVLTSRDFLLYENEKYMRCFADVIPLDWTLSSSVSLPPSPVLPSSCSQAQSRTTRRRSRWSSATKPCCWALVRVRTVLNSFRFWFSRSADRHGSLSRHVLCSDGIPPSAASSQQHCVEPSLDHCSFERVLYQGHFRARSGVPRDSRGNPSLGRVKGLIVIDRYGTSSACISWKRRSSRITTIFARWWRRTILCLRIGAIVSRKWPLKSRCESRWSCCVATLSSLRYPLDSLRVDSPWLHSGKLSPNPICRLAAYLLKSLPQETAIVVFQTLLHRILPIWLQDNYFQIVESRVPFE